MNRPRLTAQELHRRYRKGERDFAGVDLSGESLRGLILIDIDLSGAVLNRTDLRGTNFTDAKLIGTYFTETKMGTRRRWLLLQLLIAPILVFLGSFLAGVLWGTFVTGIFSSAPSLMGENFGERLISILGIAIWTGFLALARGKGLLSALVITLLAVVVAGILAVAIAVPFADTFPFSSTLVVVVNFAFGVAEIGTLAIFVNFAFVVASTIAVGVAGARSITLAVAIAVPVAFAVAVANTGAATGAVASAGALLNVIACFSIARRALSGDPRDKLIRSVSVWFASWGGSKFIGADLTDANFSKAQLKSTHLYRAKLIRTHFHLAQKVNLARLGKTILADFHVQNLLITLRGQHQSYVGLNLQGASLIGADLANADFTEADLSQATLEGAILERANLTKTQALDTCFHQTILTGATLEAWNIDSTTHLGGAICDYVYLLRDHKERRPNSGTFGPGEFTKLFQEVLDTIDLIFRDGVDWKAFIQTLNKIQVEHAGEDVAIQAIENKGDGVVVVKLKAAPAADKEAIHRSFMQRYQKALKAVEQKYKVLLQAKDSEIQSYRRESSNMYTIAQTLAQRELIHMETKFVQGDDNSRNISFGDDASGNIFSAGDGDISVQQVTLPTPESVNIQAELLALHNILASLNDPVTSGIAQKLEVEAQKDSPDKSVVGQTLETGLTYAKNLQGFADAIDKLRSHVQNAAGWLGEHGYKLLPLVGLMAL